MTYLGKRATLAPRKHRFFDLSLVYLIMTAILNRIYGWLGYQLPEEEIRAVRAARALRLAASKPVGNADPRVDEIVKNVRHLRQLVETAEKMSANHAEFLHMVEESTMKSSRKARHASVAKLKHKRRHVGA